MCEGTSSPWFFNGFTGERRSSPEGAGIGLYLSRLIAEQEKGYLTVEPAPGGGSCFPCSCKTVRIQPRFCSISARNPCYNKLCNNCEKRVTAQPCLNCCKKRGEQTMNAVETTGLGKIYGRGENAVRALQDVTFSVKQGEFCRTVRYVRLRKNNAFKSAGRPGYAHGREYYHPRPFPWRVCLLRAGRFSAGGISVLFSRTTA